MKSIHEIFIVLKHVQMLSISLWCDKCTRSRVFTIEREKANLHTIQLTSVFEFLPSK